MKRRALNLLTLLSLLLALACAALLARSYAVSDYFNVLTVTNAPAGSPNVLREFTVHSGAGGVGVLFLRYHGTFGPGAGAGTPLLPDKVEWSWERFEPEPPAGDATFWARRGFALEWLEPTSGNDYLVKGIYFPHWLPAGLFAVAPVVFLARRVARRRRAKAGFCGACGYDMRATPQRCPECGSAGAAALPAARGGATPPAEQ